MWSVDDEFLIQIVQLCLTSLVLQPDLHVPLHHFDLSQELVYASPYSMPLFRGEYMCQLNVQLALSTVNFFRFHLKQSGGEGLLAEDYLRLQADQQPQPWLGRLKEGTQQLGSHWKGAYSRSADRMLTVPLADVSAAYMDDDDLHGFRSQSNGRSQRQSVFVDNFDSFQVSRYL